MPTLKSVAVSVLLLGVTVTYAAAYDFDAHEQLADLAAGASRIGVVLVDDLGFSKGIETEVRKNAVVQAIRQRIVRGASDEDIPDLRVLNHFHNPLRPWEAAGLTVEGIQIGQSSVLWQQNTGQDSAFVGAFPLLLRVGGGTWAWQTARQLFFDALRLESAAERSNKFADLFGTLGHLTHVVQDASVPAHARNSQHVKKFGVDMSDGYEKFVDNLTRPQRAALTTGLPEFSLRFTPTVGPNVVPVARLIDTDLFQGPATASLLGSTEIGMAEYTNGNFLSDRTLFGSFALPRLSATETFDVTENGQQRTYLRKVRDGETIDFFARRGVFSSHPILAPTTQGEYYYLDSKIYETYAQKLLPMAVVYSAELLNYFFRGRLDLELIPDPNDPSKALLSGFNSSNEPIGDGELTLYADATNGRIAAPLVGSTRVEGAGVGDPISSGPFQLPDAERFVAVFTGKLGDEVQNPPFTPGAVIGKVLGGTRVEQLFSDGNRWNIRTPDGIYPLPILNDIQELVWGDAENMLVGRTAIGATAPNQFVVYRIDRGAGDPVIPLTTTGDVRLVNASPPRVGFPVNLPIASVSVTQTMGFKQYLPAALHDVQIDGAAIDPNTETWEFDANLAVNEERQTTRTRDLRLDFNTFQSLSSDGHSWRIENIYGDSNSEIFVLITSTLRLRNEFQTFPTKKYVDVCGGWPCPTIDGSPAFIPVTLPTSGLRSSFAVLINVTRGEVRSVTAPSAGAVAQIRLSHTTSHIAFGNLASSLDLPSFTVREVRRQNGPDGAPIFVQFDDTTFTCSDTVPHFDLGGASLVLGTLGADVALYTASLAAASGPSRPPAVQSSVRKICIDAFHNRPPGARVPIMTFPLDRFTFTSDRIDGILRARADGNRWAVFITKSSAGVPTEHLIRWDPDDASATLRATIPDSSADLISTSARQATVATDSQLIVVPLEGDASVVSSPADFASASGYIALEPSFIYRPSDGRFYRVSPTLQQTALPRPLASSAPLSGSYHTLKLR